MPTTHNPKLEVEQLQIILSNPSKKIGFLFGAGISMKDKDNNNLIPGVDEMTTMVIDSFTAGSKKDAIEKIKIELGNKINVESILSAISRKEKATGDEKLCGLTKVELEQLRKDIEEKIKKIVSIHVEGNFKDKNLNHYDFAKWIKNADRSTPIEIFTTNYDYLLEIGMEKYQVQYFDGFVGSCNAFFCPEWIEDDTAVKEWTKLWKLHGSLGWGIKGDDIIRSSNGEKSAMIYPSFLKYDHSRKQPYLSYMDRLSHFLRQEDSVLFVCGYSFSDEHINDLILSSLSRPRSAHVFVLKCGNLMMDDCVSKEIAKKSSKISVYANNSAVIGCEYGQWKLVSKEDQVFSFREKEVGEGEEWAGEGELQIGNFNVFTEFLSFFNRRSIAGKKNEK